MLDQPWRWTRSSITPPGGATDSIRCASPTCSPTVVYTRCTRTDFAGDDFAGVQPDPQLQGNAVAKLDTSAPSCPTAFWSSNAARHARKAWSSNAIGAPNTAITPSPVNLSTVPPKRRTYRRRPVEELGHDLAQPLGAYRGSQVHRMHDVGEQHRDLLVLRGSSYGSDPRAAAVAEPGIGAQLMPAITARVPHVNIVTLATAPRSNLARLLARGLLALDVGERGGVCRPFGSGRVPRLLSVLDHLGRRADGDRVVRNLTLDHRVRTEHAAPADRRARAGSTPWWPPRCPARCAPDP